MAVAIDASSPAAVLNPPGTGTSATGSTTDTAAFSPPAGSLLVLIAALDSPQTGNPTLTPSVQVGTALTWTLVLNQSGPVGGGGRTVIWTAPNPSAQTNMTVRLTNSTSTPPVVMKLYVLTGADTTTPVATSLSGTMSITGSSTEQQSLTNGPRANGILLSAYNDYQCGSQTAPTSSDLTVDAAGTLGGTSLDINYGFGHRTATAASTAYTATWADNYTGGASGSVASVIIQPAPGPTYVASYTSGLGFATSQTASVTTAVGDLLLYTAWSGNGNCVPAAPTGGSLTWTLVASGNSANAGGNAAAVVYSATATSAATFTLTGTTTGTSAGNTTGGQWGFQVQRWSGAQVANKWSNAGSTTAQLTFTQTTASSAIAMLISDFNAVSGTSRTYVTASAGAFTETHYDRTADGTTYTAYAGYYANDGAIASKTVGLSAPTGTLDAMVAVEIAPTPTIRARTNAASSANVTSLSVNKPAGATVGDVLIVTQWMTLKTTASAANMTAPAGWTQVGTTQTVTDATFGMFGKIWKRTVDGSEGTSFAFGFDSLGDGSGLDCECWQTGTFNANSFFSAGPTWGGQAASVTAMVAPSVTPTVANTMLVSKAAAYVFNNTNSFTPPTGMTEDIDVLATGNYMSFTSASLALAAAAASGTETFTATRASYYASVSYAVAPLSTTTATAVYMGSTNITTVYFGSAVVNAMYIGTTKVF